ncbi:CD1247 N-terminal domain-containing protein [Clostridium luticellarii]|jgi:predicted RNA-binding Zn-ribbon protein involved in translation (DUF1610 family)|uniref:Uncharacterized protein n=1 Tax=Clostridium luticellarii TaxID=1691940 RepID=A0A2T0BRV2_9CLOT|nr:CD1247 N-terminal domain-containing protein [Clostridium luticellarii]MCI1943742.1 hypothetical protein [Clostridium luticellarii]MCI1967003.1 hypothetical protein [Clostridium luticellarii]MCI1994370.1 hypothetical protein [Clostridium luticellarii]MCI2038677.1 hypothetical protein [Clostridium luticellarii]PRR86552.1 hypothetical protein CLLU_03530 [Clostridium luticellarii]
MDSIKSKVSYINGLMDGLKIDTGTNEGKVLLEILGVLKDIADEIENISEAQKNMGDYMNAMDEDLAYLQDGLYDEDYETCRDMEENFEEINCPNCNDTVYVDKDALSQKKNLTCPNCHEDIALKDIKHSLE